MANRKYLLVFKQAGIMPDEAEKICACISVDTLDRLTKTGFDRRLIKPLLLKASMKNTFESITDEKVNDLMDDVNFMTSFIDKYVNNK